MKGRGVSDVLDVFAGPRGWDVGARDLGIDALGIELDGAACETSEAAGFRTLQGDVAALDPADFAPCVGLIGSPPCPAFSMAGQGAGRAVIAELLVAIEDAVRGAMLDGHRAIIVDRLREVAKTMSRKPKHPEAWAQAQATSSLLIAEPGRWVRVLRPRWVALEQVPPGLPAWEALAGMLRPLGYHTWTGKLTSEMYGVPQTRERAIFIASLDGPVRQPAPTHRRYVAPRRREKATESLFEPPEPERIVARGEEHLLPWISMAQALGWEMNRRVGFGRRDDAPSNRQGGALEVDGVGYRERDFREASEPALALTEKSRSWVRFRVADRPHATLREVDEPAPTIALTSATWGVAAPGHHDAEESGSQAKGAVRVTEQEAAVLQGFPGIYPFRGTRTARFRQIGDAVPPPLARAVLREATRPTGPALSAKATA